MAFSMAGSYRSPKYSNRRGSSAIRKPVTITIPAGLEPLHNELMAYNGTFHLLLNLRSSLLRWGKLTDKQWDAVKKCLTPKPIPDPAQILVPTCNVPITVSASAARYIAKKNNWSINPCTLMVTSIKSIDRRGFAVTVKADWTGSVGVCRCCGKTLTDWKSQATGVGPYCVKRTGITYVRNQQDVARFQQEMADLCTKLGEVEIYIKRYHMKSGEMALEKAALSASPVKAQVSLEDRNHVIPLHLCMWNPVTRVLAAKKSDMRISVGELPQVIAVDNLKTLTMVLFVKLPSSTGSVAQYASTGFDNPMRLVIDTTK